MAALLHPGVYVQEIPSGIRSIEGVPTSTTIFVGETERGPIEPTKIRSIGDYARLFGGYLRHESATAVKVTTRYAVDLFFQNGGTVAYIARAKANVSLTEPAARTDAKIVASSPGEWANSHLWALFTTSAAGTYPARFRIVVYYQPPGGVATFVEDWDRLTTTPADENYVVDVLKRSLYVRYVEGQAPPTTPGDTITPAGTDPTRILAANLPATAIFSGGSADNPASNTELTTTILPRLDGIDDAAILVGTTELWVGASAMNSAAISGYYDTLRTYVDRRPKQDLFLIGDILPAFTEPDVPDIRTFVNGIPHTNFAAVYWPHLMVSDPVGPTATAVIRVPPSGAVAGLYARIDARRGVWKAPAGTEATIGGITRLERDTIDSEQDDLNPIGVNVLRVIPGAGTVAWGSRTLEPSSEWRYIPVRRTAMFLRKSIFNGIQFAVFEPNDTALWATLRATIGAFMETQFRNGAFAGKTSRDAYFVKVDSETTTEIDQAAGIVNILVGFAPLRPAEFVVVKLSQKTASGT